MKITPADMNKIEGAYDACAVEKNAAPGGANRLPRDRVCLSAACAAFGETEAIARAAAEQLEKSADPDRLRCIKTMVDNGTYRVDSRDVAGAILGKA